MKKAIDQKGNILVGVPSFWVLTSGFMEQHEPFGTLMVIGMVAALVAVAPIIEVLKLVVLIFTCLGMAIKLFQQFVVATNTYHGSQLEQKVERIWKKLRRQKDVVIVPIEGTTLGGQSQLS